MRLFAGGLFAVIAICFLFIGLTAETTVVTSSAPDGFAGVANLQAMHYQMVEIVIGVGAAIISALCFLSIRAA